MKPIKGTSIHGNTSYEPLNDVSTTNDAICAGEQVRQKVKMKGKNRHQG